MLTRAKGTRPYSTCLLGLPRTKRIERRHKQDDLELTRTIKPSMALPRVLREKGLAAVDVDAEVFKTEGVEEPTNRPAPEVVVMGAS